MSCTSWRKSTHSGGEGGQCVEVGQASDILVRDTKAHGTGPVLRLTPEAWTIFLATLKP